MAKALVLTSVILMTAGHLTAFILGWYWSPTMSWIDIPLHFLAGVFVASFFWWFTVEEYSRFNIFHGDFIRNLAVFLSVAALVGVLWEFFEFGFDYLVLNYEKFAQMDLAQLSKSDIMADLFFDLLGAFFAALVLGFRGNGNRAANRVVEEV